jgi:hypothetical protein
MSNVLFQAIFIYKNQPYRVDIGEFFIDKSICYTLYRINKFEFYEGNRTYAISSAPKIKCMTRSEGMKYPKVAAKFASNLVKDFISNKMNNNPNILL